jgi:GT2 family glycosyltransferase
MPEPKVCMLIINWNGVELLQDLFSSLRQTDYKNYHVIMVDNASTDESIEFTEKRFPEVDILKLKENLGYPGGSNAGMRYAIKKYNPDYLLVLNSDLIVFENDWLRKLVNVAESDDKIAIVSCSLITPSTKQKQGAAAYINWFNWSYYFGEETKEVDFVQGAVMLIKSHIARKVGGFDERMGIGYYEETEMCFRYKKHGYKIYTVPTAKIYHIGTVSFNKVPEKRKYSFYKNRILFFLTLMPKHYLITRILKDLVETFPFELGLLFKAYRDGYKLYKDKPLTDINH